MPLVPLFEKWILEHGSATLSKEVIADLRQKIVENDAAHAKEVQGLKAAQAKEVALLNEHHAEEMATLERKIAELQKPQSLAKSDITDGEKSLIKLMAAGGGSATLEAMARTLGIGIPKAQYFADNLKNRDFARLGSVLWGSNESNWSLTPKGNAYAVENGLADDVPPPPPSGQRRGRGPGYLRA
jgi:hypothetical protein